MSLQGMVKLYHPEKGFGFITSLEGQDVFLHASDIKDEGMPLKGDVVNYDEGESEIKPGQKQAKNVIGGSGTKGAGKGAAGPTAGVAAAVQGTGAFSGTCKSYNAGKGFGFIIGGDGVDIFFHIDGMVDGTTPQQGDELVFDIEESKLKPGQMQANNITGGTGWQKGRGKGGVEGGAVQGTGGFTGTCKSYNMDKGFGFIIGGDGKDIFYHIAQIVDGSTPQAGDTLRFDIQDSSIKPGQQQAHNITGGTGWGAFAGKGKGKGEGGWDAWGGEGWGKGAGKGWGEDGWGAWGKGFGPAKGGWGGDDWGDSPYGEGKGKGESDAEAEGDGKGKGKGKGGKTALLLAVAKRLLKGGGDSWGGDGW